MDAVDVGKPLFNPITGNAFILGPQGPYTSIEQALAGLVEFYRSSTNIPDGQPVIVLGKPYYYYKGELKSQEALSYYKEGNNSASIEAKEQVAINTDKLKLPVLENITVGNQPLSELINKGGGDNPSQPGNYSPGDGVSIQNGVISIKLGKGLKLDDNGNVQINLSDIAYIL